MGTLKIYVKSIVKPEPGFNAALNICVGTLKRYFETCVASTDQRLFNSAEVSLSPNSKTVGDMDLLVYIAATPDHSAMPMIPKSSDAAGLTFPFPGVGVLSEVYANKAMDEGKKLFGLLGVDPIKQGLSLANLAFHELAHNKWFGMPQGQREKYKIQEQKTNIHAVGGVMSGSLNKGSVNLGLTRENIDVMAALIQHPVKQFTSLAKYPF